LSGRAVAGVDGCRAGWVAAIALPGEPVRVAVFRGFAALLSLLPADALIAVDMPIGLPEHTLHGGRGPESLIRPLLGMRQSSVFSIPSRRAVYAALPVDEAAPGEAWAAAHRLASAVARETSTPPRGVAIQAFGLFARIREVDALFRANAALRGRVFEAHPELAFWRLNGRRALETPKKVRNRPHPPGLEARRALLTADGCDPALLAASPPRGAGADDVLDALAVLTVARRAAAGTVERFPEPPSADAFGLPIAIHV
jgi:predicted RNase H-like nuclease